MRIIQVGGSFMMAASVHGEKHVDGINTKQAFADARFEIEDGESWQMNYEIFFCEASTQRPLFRVVREGTKLSMSRLSRRKFRATTHMSKVQECRCSSFPGPMAYAVNA